MAEYTRDDRQRAREIANSLLGEGEREHREALDGLDEGFSIYDVEVHAAKFRFELELLRHLGEEFPSLELAEGPPVPRSFLSVWGGQNPWEDLAFDMDDRVMEFYYYYSRGRRLLGPKIPLDLARESFLTRASDFLTVRLSAVRLLWSRKPASAGPSLRLPPQRNRSPTNILGCYFSVSSKSPGLSAYWSGAYYISSNYLGSPTSPAVGVLQAGTYVFGINGGAYGNLVQWDTNAVCTIPGIPSVNLQY